MHVFETEIGGKKITFETGRMAKQAGGSVVVRKGDTMVLCTVCVSPRVKDGQDFFPLIVEFQEKTYAAGKIPGGFFKREGKLSELEILTSRLIDRPLRPLFPEGFMHDTQVICTVISADKENDADTLAMMGASAACLISPAPFAEPVASVRLGYINNAFVINPTYEQNKKESRMNVIVAGTKSSVMMVEGDCKEVDEKTMVEALFFAHKEIQKLIDVQVELAKKVGKAKMTWVKTALPKDVLDYVDSIATKDMGVALKITDKLERYTKKDEITKRAVEMSIAKFCGETADADGEFTEAIVTKAAKAQVEHLAYVTMRGGIIKDKKRIDGRDLTTVRPISIETGVLPRAHGSSLFTRGETQALVTCTLGASDDSQSIDTLMNSHEKFFILHYNFPPYSVGEVKMLRGPSRRDVGHGNLAENALKAMLPDSDNPYTIRIVSEILESNGSSSMATVCGGALALMDAGIQVKASVAGVAMGLVAEEGQFAILTDILGDEDHLGDMDFKVTGTRKGITGFQLDTKISGLSVELMQNALSQAKDARIHILNEMDKVLSKPRTELSIFAPRVRTVTVRQSKIKDVIGPGGKNIKSVIEQTGAKIDINDDGKINIFSSDPEMAKKAIELIEALSGEVEIGRIYEGVVRKVVEFGAFINIAPGTDGLCHISELDSQRVEHTEDIVREGDKVSVKVIEIDRQGRIKLSRKQALLEKRAS